MKKGQKFYLNKSKFVQKNKRWYYKIIKTYKLKTQLYSMKVTIE